MRTVLAFVATAALIPATARAHHSSAQFDLDRTVAVEGTIQTILYANPHAVLTIQAKDGAVYTATWRAALQLDRQGVKDAHLKVGDAVVITGNPARDSSLHELSRLSEVRRLSDGWAWRLDNGVATTGRTSLK